MRVSIGWQTIGYSVYIAKRKFDLID